MLDKVELFPAFRWECPSCHTENWVRSESHEASDEEIREELGIQPYEPIPEGIGGEYYYTPDQVMCRKCSGEFGAFYESEEDM